MAERINSIQGVSPVERVQRVSQLNRAGGLLLGALKGAVAVCLLVWLLARTGLWLTPEVLEQTRLAGAIAGWLGLAAPVSL